MSSGMETGSGDDAAARERLSALVDGELAESQVTQACLEWRGDAGARAAWHAYQWIGDVLRSEDLGSAPGHDAEFLARLRARLADEPVVLAPQTAVVDEDAVAVAAPEGVRAAPVAARGSAGRSAWRTPVAVAAGFVAVVGVVIATRVSGPAADAPALAKAVSDPALVAASTGSVAGTPPSALPAVDARGLAASNELIRDVRLDRYLSAHKQFAGTSALGVPSGFLRNATADAADR